MAERTSTAIVNRRPWNFVNELAGRRPLSAAVLTALAMVIAATALKLATLGYAVNDYPFLWYFPAVFLAAMLVDHGSGYMATVASALTASYLFIGTPYSFDIGREHLWRVALFVVIGCAVSAVAEALHRATDRLRRAERDKTILLEEMAHRTKNDLTIIIGAIEADARRCTSPEIQDALAGASARLHALALAQRHLSAQLADEVVSLPAYVLSLCDGLQSMLAGAKNIRIEPSVDDCMVSSEMALTVGLITNELITNALKYAFPTGHGVVLVSARVEDQRAIVVTVKDDGVGLAEGVTHGSGSRLLRTLAARHGGSLTIDEQARGCSVTATLPLHCR